MQDTIDNIQSIRAEILLLQAKLTSCNSEIGDWKVAKCYEYSLIGEEAPYDIAALHSKRQLIRDKINELQSNLDTLEAEYIASLQSDEEA